MAIVEIADLSALLPAGTVVAGLDLGTKTIGLAVSDLGPVSYTHLTLPTKA